MTESDGLALAMACVMGTAFVVIATLLFCIIRNASKRDPEVDDLIEEVEQEEKAGREKKPAGKVKEREDWEKDGDWWKQ
ncbi:MAG: hypothetical protein ABJQ29_07235 [Luteolibacter sp.]